MFIAHPCIAAFSPAIGVRSTLGWPTAINAHAFAATTQTAVSASTRRRPDQFAQETPPVFDADRQWSNEYAFGCSAEQQGTTAPASRQHAAAHLANTSFLVSSLRRLAGRSVGAVPVRSGALAVITGLITGRDVVDHHRCRPKRDWFSHDPVVAANHIDPVDPGTEVKALQSIFLPLWYHRRRQPH